ncbi:MAG: hypothetical protein ABFS03_06050, partial [Chloroflexota bacterium]
LADRAVLKRPVRFDKNLTGLNIWKAVGTYPTIHFWMGSNTPAFYQPSFSCKLMAMLLVPRKMNWRPSPSLWPAARRPLKASPPG